MREIVDAALDGFAALSQRAQYRGEGRGCGADIRCAGGGKFVVQSPKRFSLACQRSLGVAHNRGRDDAWCGSLCFNGAGDAGDARWDAIRRGAHKALVTHAHGRAIGADNFVL